MIKVIWDLHWKGIWKQHINSEDTFVFLWDYVDTFPPVTDEQIINNLKDIIAFKIAHPDRVILLLGNHDIQYIFPWNKCSWYRESYAREIGELFYENLSLFQFTHQVWGYVFSHAGITNDWLNYNSFELERILALKPTDEVPSGLFDVGYYRWWDVPYGWIFWADKKETEIEWFMPKWIQQVVWHTPVKDLIILPHIIYCDTFWAKQSNAVLELNIK